MTIDPTSEKPIFLQIAEQLEDAIFTGIYPGGEKVPSTNEIAALLAINPHTVLKGMNLLVDEGMFVSDGAVAVIQKKRQAQFYERYIEPLVVEAEKLAVTKDEVIALIERGYNHERD